MGHYEVQKKTGIVMDEWLYLAKDQNKLVFPTTSPGTDITPTSNFQGKRNAALVAFFLVTGQQLAGVLSPLSGGCHLLHPSRCWGEQEKIK